MKIGATNFMNSYSAQASFGKKSNDDASMVRDFQGFLTSYKFTEKENRLFGMHLNGLLHRVVIPPLSEMTNTAENIARTAINGIDWLTLGNLSGQTNTVTYETTKYLTADTFIQDLLVLDNAGYRIKADVPNKRFIFEVIPHIENRLVISENNLKVTYKAAKAVTPGQFCVLYSKDTCLGGGMIKEVFK